MAQTQTTEKKFEVTELKKLIGEKTKDIKALFIANKVKKENRNKEYFLKSAMLFDNFDINIKSYCEEFKVDTKYVKLAERKGLEAIKEILSA